MAVSEQSGHKSLNLQLWFGKVLVAELTDVIPHQGTWFALYRQVVAPGLGPLERRLCDFMAFCEEWHQRLKSGESPKAAEFDQFTDVIESRSWRVPCPDGTELTMTQGPVFAEGQASWNHADERPSRELAAGEVWSRLTSRRFAPPIRAQELFPDLPDWEGREIELQIRGLGIILYSPPAVAHIPEGSDYLNEHFWQPVDVARHVMACQLTAFCTGSPGNFRLRLFGGSLNEEVVAAATFKLRLGLQVHEERICLRDLYDLMRWRPECPPEQQLAVPDGWYRLTVFSSPSFFGTLGDDQVIAIHLEPMPTQPLMRWEGVPLLCNSGD
jgi:hypothetical protein